MIEELIRVRGFVELEEEVIVTGSKFEVDFGISRDHKLLLFNELEKKERLLLQLEPVSTPV